MNHNKLILPLLLVAVVVSLGFGSSYAQTDESELVDQINRLNDRLLELQATHANIENKIDKFETKRDNVQAGLDRLQERGGSEEKIEKRIAKLANIDKNIAKLEANKIKNQEKIDDIELEIADKRSELAGTGPSATQSDRSGRGEAPRGLAESDSSSDEGATGASNHIPAQITDFRATFIPHNVNNTNPQAGAYWDKPERVSITGYVLEHMSSDETEFTLVELDSDIKSYFIDAEYGLDYSFKIAATNSNGTGPVSVIQTVTVIRYDQDPPVFDSVADYTYSGSSLLLPLTYDLPTATDTLDDNVEVTCTPDKLYVGENEIFCRAYDDAGNLAETSFTITVPERSFDPIDCTINVAVGGEVVREFHPSECSDQYDGLILADIPRSMLYGKATIDHTHNIVEITGPEMSPVLTPSRPLIQEELDYLVSDYELELDGFEFMPRQAKSESFGITLDPRYGIDKPAINIAVNYVPIPDIMINDYLGASVTHDLPTPGVPANYTFVSVRSTDQLRDDGVSVRGTESDGIIALTFTLPETSELDTITGHVVLRYNIGDDDFQTFRVPVIIDFLPDITIAGNLGASVIHKLPIPSVSTDYEFVSVGVSKPLKDGSVSVRGAEFADGIIAITFNLPDTSDLDTITGHVIVRYNDTNDDIQKLRVPVTIDYFILPPITVNGTSGESVEYILEASNVPEDYVFHSATQTTFLTRQGVTATSTESDGDITFTFNLPNVSEETAITGDVIVKYNDGNGDRQKFRVHATITVLP